MRFGDLSATFSAFDLDGALPDVLEIPSAPRVLAESWSGYSSPPAIGYFADDGGYLPVGTDMQVEVPPALPPPNLGPYQSDHRRSRSLLCRLLDARPPPTADFYISFRVSGVSESNDFTAALNDAADPMDRTSVSCLGDVCTVTIPEGANRIAGCEWEFIAFSCPTVRPNFIDIPAPVWMVVH